MGRPANFRIEFVGKRRVIIRDIGPWDVHLSVTNDIEGVIERLSKMVELGGLRVSYIDTDGIEQDVKVENGKFAGWL